MNFNKIIRLQNIRIEKLKLLEEENILSTPLLTDKNLIYEIYKIFIELMNEQKLLPSIDNVIQRKKFIFIILFMFSPSALAGGKMIGKLREELSNVLQIHSKSTISDNCADITFLYQTYPDFSKDVEFFYTEITKRLNIKVQ